MNRNYSRRQNKNCDLLMQDFNMHSFYKLSQAETEAYGLCLLLILQEGLSRFWICLHKGSFFSLSPIHIILDLHEV